MFSLQDAEHPQHRDRGRVRRLPGHRQGGVGRPRRSSARTASARSTRSTGRGSRRRSSTTSPATSRRRRANDERGQLRRAVRQLRQHLRRPRRAQMGLPIAQLVLATNENDVLDEFFRTGALPACARGARRTRLEPVDGHLARRRTSSASCSTCVGRDAGARARCSATASAATARSTSSARPEFAPRRAASASSPAAARTPTASRRSATRYERFGMMIDTHTADGLKVAREHAEPGVPMIVLETALPAKFAATIARRSAASPQRPAALRGLEALPQRFDVDAGRRRGREGFIADRLTRDESRRLRRLLRLGQDHAGRAADPALSCAASGCRSSSTRTTTSTSTSRARTPSAIARPAPSRS